VVPVRGPEPDAGAVVQPRPAPPGLVSVERTSASRSMPMNTLGVSRF
jgi:hypothetical protein